MITQLFTGILLGIIIAYLAWRARSLSVSGAIAAAICGGLIFGFGGLPWAALLLTFFISSSALSRAFAIRKTSINEKFSKGSQRDWGQVLANGGIGAMLAIAYAIWPDQSWIWPAYVGSMAAVTADTWATELGVLSPQLPRLVTTWKPVERGTSGAISLPGTLAATSAALLIGLVGGIFTTSTGNSSLQGTIILVVAVLGGLSGSLIDSLLGATVQAIYTCPTCQKETERHPLHTCQTPTIHKRGYRWLNNDWVNLTCALTGAMTAAGLWQLFS